MRKILFLILFITYTIHIFPDSISSGLYFSSHAVIKELRTSLYFSAKDLALSEGFTVDFDIKLRSEEHNYGYVFRIISDNNKSFDFISNITKGRRSLSLIEGNSLFISFEQDSLADYQWNKWAHITCKISTNEVKLFFNNKEINTKCHYTDFKKLEFNFGCSTHQDFMSSDVPPMSIRNIELKNNKNQVVAYWPLREHNLNTVYDNISNRCANVDNPIWEIDKHTKWTKEYEFSLPIYTQICYNSSNNLIYLANSSNLLACSIAENKIDTISVVKGNPYIERYNQTIYHPYFNEVWSYDFDKNVISVFCFDKMEWSHTDSEIKNPDYSQHNAFISAKDSSLYILGGYGNYQYKNTLLKKSKNEKEWEEINYQPKLTPRYLGGLGYKNKDTIFIFGGCGNKSGKQELGSNDMYDLHMMDLNTLKTTKLWEINNNKNEYVIGNSIIIDEKLNKLFALCFPNNRSNSYILLKSFDLTTGESTNYADTIPFIFNDVNSFCTLYHNIQDSQIYAVTAYHQDKTSEIKVYSLAYPPLTEDAIPQIIPENHSIQHWLYILSITFILFATLFILKWRKKKAKSNDVITIEGKEIKSFQMAINKEQKDIQPRSSIILLGGFQVWNKNGEDITKSFTPILKQLLILIILYKQKNKKGIPNVTLREILWFDKTEESAQNNRRVNIRKLKVLLEDLDGVELTKDNTYWLLKFGSNAYCDYIDVCNFMDKLTNNHNISPEDLKEFPIDIFSGQLLPYIQNEWIDTFKSEYTNSILDALIALSKLEIVSNDNTLIIKIANLMFTHDRIDEYALTIKCQALCRCGKIGLAKSEYENFCSEYKAILDTDYKKSFKDISMCNK